MNLPLMTGQKITYLNPWKTNYCKNKSNVIVNVTDDKYQYSAKGNKVLIRGLKKKDSL